MEKIIKPAFIKVPANKDKFQELRQQVNETVKSLENRRKYVIHIKAFFSPFSIF